MFFKGLPDGAERREMGAQCERVMNQGDGNSPGSSCMSNASPLPPYAFVGQPPPFPVVLLRGLPLDCTGTDIAEFFHGLDIVDVLFVHRHGNITGEAFCVLAYSLQVEFALQKNRQSIGRRNVEVFRSQRHDYYKAIANEVSEIDSGSPCRSFSRAKSHDEGKESAEHTGILQLSGLRFSASKDEILDILKEFLSAVKAKATGVEIPLDLIIDALLQLPLKDLVRFRCVSKPLNSLIDSRDFIELHLSHSPKTCTNVLGIFNYTPFMLLDFENPMKTLRLASPSKPVPPATANKLRILGSCNGLVALRDGKEDLILWNPFTAKSQTLPLSRNKVIFRKYKLKPDIIYGFGYDPYTDDYKVFERMFGGVEIYSMRNNSWRQIKDSGDAYFNITFFDAVEEGGVLVSNTLHWAVLKGACSRKIVAFDLVKEEFSVVPLPKYFCGNLVMNVGVLGGCLCMTADYRKPADRGVDIWVMKEYGVRDSWIKLFSLPPNGLKTDVSNDAVVPLAYSKSGNQVLVNWYGHLYWYDLVKERSKPLCDFPFGFIPSDHLWMLSESLVAPNWL